MRRWRARGGRAAALLAGLLFGLFFVALVLFFYTQAAREGALRYTLMQALDIPSAAVTLEEMAEGRMRVAARNLVLLDEAGDTIVSAPSARFWLDPAVLGEAGPIVLSDVELRDPYLRLVQLPTGEWNIQRSMRVVVEEQEIAPAEEGRPIVLAGVRITGGRAVLATPLAPEAPTPGAEDVRLARFFGQTYQVRGARAVEAQLPLVRVGGSAGWRVEVGSLSAVLTDPELRVAQLRGVFEEVPDGFGFDVQTLQTDRSALAGAGRIRTVGERALFDLQLTADPLHFEDLRWVSAMVPPEGVARGTVSAASLADGRTLWGVRDLEVVALDSRVTGRASGLIGGEVPITFRDTDLQLDPLDLRLAEEFGFGEQVPFHGELRGRVATVEEVEGREGPLRVDLVATLTPRDLPNVPASTIAAQGTLALDAEAGARLDGLLVSAQPLQLAALRPLLPEQEEWLRGVVRGSVLLGGTPADLRLTDGNLLYEIGDAPPTRLAGLTGSVATQPELRFELSAFAQPLALASVAELLPAFPFRRAVLAGPIEIAGTPEAIRFDVTLRGDVGGFAAQGTFAPGDPASFRVAGRLEGLQPARLLQRPVPLAGPVSGPFLVEGTTRDLRFDVDLTQAAGGFALGGRVQLPPDMPPLVQAEGRLADFRIGTLIGRTGLFDDPLTGEVRVSGGGAQAYTVDTDLEGPGSVLDVNGWYLPREVPVYAASGRIAGLNLRLVPGMEGLPPTYLVAAFAVDGQGTTLETLAGRYDVNATGTLIGGMSLQDAVLRAVAGNRVLQVDTLALSVAGARLDASGAWGLTQPAARPLHFALASPNLAALTPILRTMRMVEPRLTGSLAVQGTVTGTVEEPILNVAGRGRNLRYDGWRAATLALQLDVAREPAGWAGQGNVVADHLVLRDTERFEAVRLEAVGTPAAVAVGLFARRDRATDLALSGTVEMEGQVPQGVALQSLALRVAQSEWQLERPTVVRWGEVTGIQVDSLVLRRTGVEEGWIVVDGRMPPTGALSLNVSAANVDVGELRRLVPMAPPVDGVLTLEAALEGPPTTPELFVDARVEGLRYLDAAADTILLSGRYAAGALVAEASVWQNQLRVATASGTIPMQLVFEQLLPRFELLDAQPVTARLDADSLSLALISAAVPQVSDGAGVVVGEITVEGALGSPTLQGAARVVRGELTMDALNVRFTDINGQLALDGQAIVIQSLTARSGGAASLAGRIAVDDRSRPLLDLRGSFDQFRGMARADVADIVVSGAVALAGRYPTPTLSGRVELSTGTVTLPSMDDRQVFEIGALEAADFIGEPIELDVLEPTLVDRIRIQGLEVVIGDAVWAESPEMRIQIGGELLVSRLDPETWQVFGDLQARRGTYTLMVGPLVREFDVASGRIEFFGTPDLNPAVDIVAQHRVRATGAGGTGILNILVNISGSAQFPRVSLTTDTQPPLPESEILSYLIFGRPTFALGEVGGGLAQQLLVQEFAGGLLANQVEQLIRQAGLPFDYIRLRGRPSPTEFAADPLGTTTLEVGWQIVPDVFWTVEWAVGVLFGGDLGDTWGTSLEWRVDRNWSTRFAWEPLRRDLMLQRQRLIGGDLLRQFTLEVRRRWAFGLTDEPVPLPDVAQEGEPEPAGASPVAPTTDAPPPPPRR